MSETKKKADQNIKSKSNTNPKASNKKKTKADDESYVDLSEEEEVNKTIFKLQQSLFNDDDDAGSKKKPQKRKNDSINIKEYELHEAEETKPKKKKVAEPKVRYNWSCGENACLKLLVQGCSPLGKNSGCMKIIFIKKC